MEDRILLQDTLVSISVDGSTIEEIMSILRDQEVRIAADPVQGVQEGWFGGSYTGGVRLATNTAAAGTVVQTEMTNFVTGLRQYRESIKAFAEDVQDTDATIAVSMTRIHSATDCVDGAPATQCSPPTKDS